MGQGPPDELSDREQEILRLVATGATNQQVAFKLTISINTVKAHLRSIFAKLGVESRTEATLFAIQHGLVAVTSADEERSTSDSATHPRSTTNAAATGQLAVPLPPMHLLPGQGIAMVLTLLLVIAVAVWPGAEARSSATVSRFIDSPKAASPEVEVTSTSRWQAKSQMPTPRGRFAQTQVDGTIFVIGGQTEAGWSAQVDAYDTGQDRWDRRAAKPTAVANVGAVVVDGLIYVPGGLDQNGVVRDILEIYDPKEDTWTTGTPLPVALCAYALAALDRRIYLFGGWDGQRYLDSVYRYDVTQGSWHEEAPLSTPRSFAAATAVNGRLYVVGGYAGGAELGLCESFDPALAASGQNPWKVHAPMSLGRAGHALAASQGSLYVVGGGWDSYFAYNERYDVANEAWSTFESPLVGEWRTLGLSAVPSKNGTFLYAMGGWSGRYLGVVQAYQASFRVYLP